LDARADDGLQDQLDQAKRRLRTLSNRINDLFEMSGEGSEHDRKETKDRLRAAQSERTVAQSETNRLQQVIDGNTSTISAGAIDDLLSEGSPLLVDAASGDLGEEAVYKALAVFRALTGGQIWVHVEQRANRKRTNVRGSFIPRLIDGSSQRNPCRAESREVMVWLRKPPRLDVIAKRVHELIDEEGMSHRETARQLQREGHKVNSGNVWYSYGRWYQMQGLEPPKVPYNNGKQRRSREPIDV
jgi:hypothetical protein